MASIISQDVNICHQVQPRDMLHLLSTFKMLTPPRRYLGNCESHSYGVKQFVVSEKFIWNKIDKSPNLSIMKDKKTISREPVSYCTDAARANLPIKDYIHSWKITWPRNQRGKHAMVGICTEQMPLISRNYVPLVGNDDNSWGLDLSTGLLHHDGECYTYVSMAKDKNNNMIIGDEIILTLNMNLGTLCYSTPGGACLGIAFDNLAGKVLYPTISTVWGKCNISIDYLGTLLS